MRRHLRGLPVAIVVLALAGPVCAQNSSVPTILVPDPSGHWQADAPLPGAQVRSPLADLGSLQKDVNNLQLQLAAAQAGDKQDDGLKKKVELLQKQIETQQKMIQLLVDHVKTQPLAGSPVEKLQTQVITMEARSQQAARRDQELAHGIDNITE